MGKFRHVCGPLATATLDWSQYPAVEGIPAKVSGASVFKDTRMAVATVFQILKAGLTVQDVIEAFSVSAKHSSLPRAHQVEAVRFKP